MKVFTISYNGMTKVYTSREAAEKYQGTVLRLDPAMMSLGPIQEHDILVDVAVCVRNGMVESAVATGNVTLDVYDCDDQDLVEDDAWAGQPQTAGEKAQVDFEALAASSEYITIY